jgi:hypothetical protein
VKSFRLTLVAAGAALLLLAAGTVLGATVSSGEHAKQTGGHAFQAAAVRPTQARVAAAVGDPTASQLLAMTRSCDEVSDGKYAMREGGRERISVCKKKSAYFWTSDMAIDCDGQPTDACNPDTDSTFSEGTNFKTSTGEYFTADVTRYFVIPLPSYRFDYRDAGIKPGNVGAVIYNNKLVYAVLADLGPADSIGEASYATAKALGVETDPSIGGTAGPVTFIVFPGVVPDPVEENAVITRVGTAAARSFLGMSAPAPENPHPAPARASTPKSSAPPAEAQKRGATPKPTKVLAGGAKRAPAADAKKTPAAGPAEADGATKAPTPKPAGARGATKPPKPDPTAARAHAPAHKRTPKPTTVHADGAKKAPTHAPAPKPTRAGTPAPDVTATETADASQRDDARTRDGAESDDDTPDAKPAPDTADDDEQSDEDGTRAGDRASAESETASGQIIGPADRCVDVVPSTGNVELFGCDGSDAQVWTVREDGTVRALGGCLAVAGDSTGDGARVQVGDCDGSDSQQWALDSGGLVNVNSGRCLDATDGGTADGTPLQIWACSFGPNQQWSLPDESGG